MKPSTGTLVLIGINGVLWLAVALVRLWPISPNEHVRAMTPTEVPLLPPVSDAPVTEVALAGLRDSPVFYQSRRWLVEEDPAELLATQPKYVLAATLVLPRKKSIAYLRAVDGPATTVRVQEGDNLAGWTVKTVDVHRVVVTRGSLAVDILPVAKPESAGLIRWTPGTGPASGGVRVLAATGRAGNSRANPPRESRVFRPPPVRAPPKG